MKTAMVAILAALGTMQAQTADPPRFEVASVTPVRAGNGAPPKLTRDGFESGGSTLRALLVTAFHVGNSQISGGPGWMDSELFAVRAKAPAAVDAAQIREMLQTLLAERFQLKVRHEMKEVPALALVVARKPREGYLTAVDGSDCKSEEVRDNPCGQLSAGPTRVIGKKVTMAQLVQMLTVMGQRRMVDRTELKGVYDLKLDLAMPDPSGGKSQGEMMQEQIANLFAGLESQLGFKTEPIKWQDPIIVIEHVERPTEN